MIDPAPRARGLAGTRGAVGSTRTGRRGSVSATAVAAAVLVAGCAAASGNAAGVGPGAASSSGAANLSVAPSDLPAPSGGAGPSSGGASAGSRAGSGGPASPTRQGPGSSTARPPTDLPSPAGMRPPTATAASVRGCQALTGGGWQATFVVTLTGGTDWTVVPQHGPATRTGADQWTVVVRQGTSAGATVRLTWLEVGGGTPYRTATVTLGPGVAAAATCPS